MLRVGKGQTLPSPGEAASFSAKQKGCGQQTGKLLIAEIKNCVLPDSFFIIFFLIKQQDFGEKTHPPSITLFIYVI